MIFNYKKFIESNSETNKVDKDIKPKFNLTNGKLAGSLEYINFKVAMKHGDVFKVRFTFQANTKQKYYLDIVKRGNDFYLHDDELSKKNIWFINENEAKMFVDFINDDDKISKKLEGVIHLIKFISFLNI